MVNWGCCCVSAINADLSRRSPKSGSLRKKRRLKFKLPPNAAAAAAAAVAAAAAAAARSAAAAAAVAGAAVSPKHEFNSRNGAAKKHGCLIGFRRFIAIKLCKI